MSIKARIEDAEYLWQQGRIEAAWIMALIAADATAKKRYLTKYPGEQNALRFKEFIRDETILIMTGNTNGHKSTEVVFCSEKFSPGKPLDLDSKSFDFLVYKYLRCNLLHEGKMPFEVTFSPITIQGDQMIETWRVGNNKNPHVFCASWVHNLIKAIREAPENRNEFCDPSTP